MTGEGKQMKYKNLVFDVGNVLIGFRWKEMMQDHGLTAQEAEAFGRDIFTDPLWAELDLENLPFAEVVRLYEEKYPQHADNVHFLFYRSELMSVPRPDVWEAVGRLKEKGYRIYLLSNYSSVLFEKHTAGAAFHAFLDGKMMSYDVHVVKPDPSIYRHLFARYGLEPGECLFFDDREENVAASRQLGMDAVRIVSKEQLLEELGKL